MAVGSPRRCRWRRMVCKGHPAADGWLPARVTGGRARAEWAGLPGRPHERSSRRCPRKVTLPALQRGQRHVGQRHAGNVRYRRQRRLRAAQGGSDGSGAGLDKRWYAALGSVPNPVHNNVSASVSQRRPDAAKQSVRAPCHANGLPDGFRQARPAGYQRRWQGHWARSRRSAGMTAKPHDVALQHEIERQAEIRWSDGSSRSAGGTPTISRSLHDFAQTRRCRPTTRNRSGKPKPCGDLEIVHAHQG